MIECTAALLAGGRSRRMGTDKAFLPWQGRPLYGHQLEKLRRLQPRQLLLSCRPEQPFPPDPGLQIVHDTWPDCGPLGGIASCMEAASAPLLVVLGIDLPFLPVEFLGALLMESTPECGTVVLRERDDRPCYEPLAAVYPVTLRDLAKQRLASGQLAMQSFIQEGIRLGSLRESQALYDPAWFTNLNSPGDLAGPD